MNTPNKHSIGILLAALALAGCQGNGSEPAGEGRQDAPTFTATIGAETRASGHAWDPGDEIGITGAGRSNVCHRTAEADGKFNVKEPGEQIYFPTDGEETFTAYYPWTALSAGATAIAFDTKDQTNQKGLDFLWATGTGKKDSPNVALKFTHRMAKLVVTVKPGEDMAFEAIRNATLSLGGCRHAGTFAIADGSVSANGTAGDAWTFSGFGVSDDAASTRTFPLILCPQVFSAPLEFTAVLPVSADDTLTLTAGLDFTEANRGKDDPNARNEWVAGRQYNLTITLSRTSMQPGTITITDWDMADQLEMEIR